MGEERKTLSKIASLYFTAPPSAEPAAACSATPPARWRSGGGRMISAPTKKDSTLDQGCRGGARRVKQTSRGLVCSPSGEQSAIATWDCPSRCGCCKSGGRAIRESPLQTNIYVRQRPDGGPSRTPAPTRGIVFPCHPEPSPQTGEGSFPGR